MNAVTPLLEAQIQTRLAKLCAWKRSEGAIEKRFQFKNFHDTMAFTNAVAWIAHTHNHHPQLRLSYGQCHVSFTTHSLNALSHLDFACAAQVDALLADGS